MIYLQAVMYLLTFGACITHLNRVRHQKPVHIAAFAVATAGSAGCFVSAIFGHEPRAAWELMYNVGIAAVAVLYFGIERRRHSDPAANTTGFNRRFERVQ